MEGKFPNADDVIEKMDSMEDWVSVSPQEVLDAMKAAAEAKKGKFAASTQIALNTVPVPVIPRNGGTPSLYRTVRINSDYAKKLEGIIKNCKNVEIYANGTSIRVVADGAVSIVMGFENGDFQGGMSAIVYNGKTYLGETVADQMRKEAERFYLAGKGLLYSPSGTKLKLKDVLNRVFDNMEGRMSMFEEREPMSFYNALEEAMNADASQRFSAEERNEGTEERTDNQGNPIDENGKLIVDKIENIDELTDEDFTEPTRSVELPKIPDKVDKAIGADGKPVVIKKNIFGKNRRTHPNITPEQGRNILKRALYAPNLYGRSQPVTRPNYWVAIQTADLSSVVVIEVNKKKDNNEIVGWRVSDREKLEQLKRQAEREGGQFLILTSEDAAAALSALPSDSSSDRKGSENSGTSKENGENSTKFSAEERRVESIDDFDGREGTRFSVVETPEGRSLVGIHNITEDKLRKALKLGGFANPSVAVVDLDKRIHTDFGDISLLLPSEKIDRRSGRNGGTWIGDAWTPKFPDTSRKMSESGEQKMLEDINSLPEAMRLPVRTALENWEGGSEVRGEVRDRLAYLYLNGRGLAPEVMTRTYTDRDGNRTTSNDTYRTARNAMQYITDNGLEREFDKWVDSLDGRYEAQNVIFDGFTPSGNRRYIPATAENVSKWMNKQGSNGSFAGWGGGNVTATAMRRIGTLDEIRGNRNRLVGDDWEMVSFYNKLRPMEDRLISIAGNGDIIEGSARLAEAMRQSNPRGYLESEFGIKLSDEESKELSEYVRAVREELPTLYFETKFNRPVTLDEFASAVVPEGADSDIVSALEGAGLKVSTYKQGDYNDRKRAVKEAATEEVRFSAEEREIIDKERRETADYLTGNNYASELTGNEFPRGEESLVKRVVDYYDKNYNGKEFREGIGEVVLNGTGVWSSIRHGLRRNKVVAFAAVPEIITKGRIIDTNDNWEGKGYDSVTIAAPIKIKQGIYIGTVIITKGKNASNFRFYLHKVNSQKSLLNEQANRVFSTNAIREEGTAKVLRNILFPNNNSENVNFSAEERELSDADTRETVSDIENPEGDTSFSATERVATTEEARERFGSPAPHRR